MFRGREVTHPERGQMILDRLAEELDELAMIEQRPNLDGRNMTMILGPSKAVLSGAVATDGDTNGAAASVEAGETEPAEAEVETAEVETEPEAAEVEAEAEAADVEAESAEAPADDGAEPESPAV